jgi:phosphotransferase system enzyme I (PtsI)
MIEVPSAVVGANQITREADFVSIGTNDLLQYLLAIDRTNDQVAYLYQPLHPAVVESIRHVVQAANENNTPVSICGEMAGEIIHVPVLIGLGFRELSMNAGSIPRVKRLIREISKKDCEELTQQITNLHSAEEIKELAQNFLETKLATESQVWTPNFGIIK